MTITDDEREVFDWLKEHAARDSDGWRTKYARTILALLDRPTAALRAIAQEMTDD